MTEKSQVFFHVELETTKDWLFNKALPLWSTLGTDTNNGGFYERLTPEGIILHDVRRTRLVARQIYVFATAHALGWRGDSLAYIQHGLNYLMSRCRQDDGNLVASLDPATGTANSGFQLYDYAFALFGLAAVVRAMPNRAPAMEKIALELLEIIQSRCATTGGYYDQPDQLHSNPHMHLLEAAIAWGHLSSAPVWHTLCADLVALCVTRFIDSDCQAVREHFDNDWQLSDGPNPIEPGHQFEWAWLLMDWAAINNHPATANLGQQLAQTGENHGIGPLGFAVNEISAQMDIIDGRHRLWPQTERIKAHTALYAQAANESGRILTLNNIAQGLKNMRRFFEHPVQGQWWEHLAPDGTPMHEPSRASSLYHIVCAISEADKLAYRLEQQTMAIA